MATPKHQSFGLRAKRAGGSLRGFAELAESPSGQDQKLSRRGNLRCCMKEQETGAFAFSRQAKELPAIEGKTKSDT